MFKKLSITLGILIFMSFGALYCQGAEFAYQPFIITVTDQHDGRPVPLVELVTVNKRSFYTDSNGQIAFYEPGLMDIGNVYFHVNAPHGYKEIDADAFGYRGVSLQPTPHGSARIALEPDSSAGDRPRYTKRQLFRLNNNYDTTSTTFKPFRITVIDDRTHRPVPMVELRTDDQMSYYTDSAGRIAFYEPGCMDKQVTFTVKSYGYAGPGDGTITLKATPGKSVQIALKRINIAERLYRVTGEGIYRDSVMMQKPVPLENPVISGKVLGQDTVDMTRYNGKLFWLWGDTEQPSYPLGNFKTSSATSEIPDQGGLDPSQGVNLEYFVDDNGFSRQMFPHPQASLVWMNTLVTIDDNGNERLLASYNAMEGDWTSLDRGIAIFNDAEQRFESLVSLEPHHNIIPDNQAHKKDGYVYVNSPHYPIIRIKADMETFKDPTAYEAFTCLKPGTDFKGPDSQIHRDEQGNLIWDWKKNTAPVADPQWQTLIEAGLVEQSQTWNRIVDVDRQNHVRVHRGSAAYNQYYDCWIMLINEEYGSSYLGEIWLAAAKDPHGPWTRAIKVVTHTCDEDVYTFYNVVYHNEFDQNDGRYIYFEGTYVTTYSGNPDPTPGYDYNQIMYRIDLADERLLPIWENVKDNNELK